MYPGCIGKIGHVSDIPKSQNPKKFKSLKFEIFDVMCTTPPPHAPSVINSISKHILATTAIGIRNMKYGIRYRKIRRSVQSRVNVVNHLSMFQGLFFLNIRSFTSKCSG